MSPRIIRDQSKFAQGETRPGRLLAATEPRQSSETEAVFASGETPRQVFMGLDDQPAALAASRERLALTIHGLVADLATSRRECRYKQQEIDSLKTGNARLVAAPSPSVTPDDQDLADPHGRGKVQELGTRLSPLEHTMDWLTSAVLMLRRANLALKEENASLRLELAHPHATASRRAEVTSAGDP